ncbi:unnamed protein product [Arctogadus glacialis]
MWAGAAVMVFGALVVDGMACHAWQPSMEPAIPHSSGWFQYTNSRLKSNLCCSYQASGRAKGAGLSWALSWDCGGHTNADEDESGPGCMPSPP